MPHSSFLTLPAELRLTVYRELIISSIHACQVTHIKRLFFSCRQINREMEEEYIRKARPVLRILRDWRSTWDQAGVVELQFGQSNDFEEAIKITGMVCAEKLFNGHQDGPYPKGEYGLSLSEFLGRVFRHSHPVFTLSTHVENFHWIIRSERTPRGEQSPFSHLERLVLRVKVPTPQEGPRYETSMRNNSVRVIGLMLGYNIFPEIRKRWVARLDTEYFSRWMLGFDFRHGLSLEDFLPSGSQLLYSVAGPK